MIALFARFPIFPLCKLFIVFNMLVWYMIYVVRANTISVPYH